MIDDDDDGDEENRVFICLPTAITESVYNKSQAKASTETRAGLKFDIMQ